jgi:heptosyltransferase I
MEGAGIHRKSNAAVGDEGSAPRVLVILLGALGDVARGLAVVRSIKDSRPEWRISWLVEPPSKGLVALHPDIEEVLVFERSKGARGALDLYRELSQRRFDITLDLQRHLKSGFFSWLSRAPRRIGFHPRDTKEGNWFFNNEYIPERGEAFSKLDHYQLFVEKLGLAVPEVLDGGLAHLSLETAREEVRSLLPRSYIGVIVGSSRDSKDWPEEGYKGLIERCTLGGIEALVLLGDRSREAMAERLAGALGSVPVVNLVGRTTLPDLVAVISGARACIGPDSGPGHIAGSLGVPHVTLFGPTPSSRNAPRGSSQFAVTSRVACSPCSRRVCPGLNKLCMRLITPEDALTTLQKALAT